MDRITPRQEPTNTASDNTQTNEATTSRSSNPEATNTSPRTTNSPSQTTPDTSTDEPATSSTPSTTTRNDATTSRASSTSIPPTTTSSLEASESTSITDSRTSSISSQTSATSSTTEGLTSSASDPTQSETTRISLSPTTSIPTITSSSNTQASSFTSSSSFTDSSTLPASSSIVTTSLPGSETSSFSATPNRTPTPTPSSTSPQQPTASSESGSTSSITSIVVTRVSTVSDGGLITFTTVVPTLASSPGGSSGLNARTSKIVGGVVGGTLAVLGVLLVLFYFSRRRRKVAAAKSAPRLQAPRQLLDTEDFDLSEPGPAPYQYGVVGARVNPNASGSIFHEALPGTTTHTSSHSYSRSLVGENDPLLAHHMRGGSADIDSITTSSPRGSTHFRASSTTGLLYDSNDPFASMGSSSSRSHPAASAKAMEARSRTSDQHVYPPSSYRGPSSPPSQFPTASGVVVHRDAGRVDMPDAPPGYPGDNQDR